MANIFYLRNDTDLTAAHTRLGITTSSATLGANPTAGWYVVADNGMATAFVAATDGTGADKVYLTEALVGVDNNPTDRGGDNMPFSAGAGADTYIITTEFAEALATETTATTSPTRVIIHDQPASNSAPKNIFEFESGVTITGAEHDGIGGQVWIDFSPGGTAKQLTLRGGRNTDRNIFKLGENGAELGQGDFVRALGPSTPDAKNNPLNKPHVVNDTPVLMDITPPAMPITYTDTAADDTFTPTRGTFMATDTDTANDAITFSIADATALPNQGQYTHELAGTYGTLRFHEMSGEWRYIVNDAAVEALTTADGSVNDTFAVTATDDNGNAPASKDLVINFTGADEANTPAVITDLEESDGHASTVIHGVEFRAVDPGAAGNAFKIDMQVGSNSPSIGVFTKANNKTYIIRMSSSLQASPSHIEDFWNGITGTQASKDKASDRMKIITAMVIDEMLPKKLSNTLARDDGGTNLEDGGGIVPAPDGAVALVYGSDGALDTDMSDTAARGSVSFVDVNGITTATQVTATATYGTVTGTVTITPTDGNSVTTEGQYDWTYTLNPGDPQTALLAAGEYTDKVIITVADDAGGVTTHEIAVAVTITGTAAHLATPSADTRFDEAPTPPATEVDKAVALDWGTPANHDLAASGTLTITDTDGVASITHTAGQYGAFSFDEATGGWTYTLDPNNPKTVVLTDATMETITFTVTDDTGKEATENVVITIGVTGTPTNMPPTITPVTPGLTVAEDATHTFAATHFGFTAGDPGDMLKSVVIVSLPEKGVLMLGNAAVTAGQVIPAASIATLTYNPGDSFLTDGNATFTYAVIDDDDVRSEPAMMSIAVTGANDDAATALTLDETSATLPANIILTEARVLANIAFTDPDGGEPGTLQLMTPGTGGGAATAPDARFMLSPDNSKLMLMADADLTAGDMLSVRVQLMDAPTIGADYTLTVGADNAIPTAADQNIDLPEDKSHIFWPDNFGFADGDAGDALTSITIKTLPTTGMLTFDGEATAAGKVITWAELDEGLLVYTPPGDLHEDTPATFTYSVNDGKHESTDASGASATTMTITIKADNDPATGVAVATALLGARTTLPQNVDTTTAIKVADITLTGDPDGGPRGLEVIADISPQASASIENPETLLKLTAVTAGATGNNIDFELVLNENLNRNFQTASVGESFTIVYKSPALTFEQLATELNNNAVTNSKFTAIGGDAPLFKLARMNLMGGAAAAGDRTDVPATLTIKKDEDNPPTLVVTANDGGTDGNAITIMVESDANLVTKLTTATEVAVTGTAIVVTYDADFAVSGTPTPVTLQDIVGAINADSMASMLVTASSRNDGDGSTQSPLAEAFAVAQTMLTGGMALTGPSRKFELNDDQTELLLKAGTTISEGDTLEVRVQLVENTAIGASNDVGADYTLTIGGDNNLPTATDQTLPASPDTFTEDDTYTFKVADFGFADSDSGDALVSVTIASLPMFEGAVSGTLALDGVLLTAANLATTGANIAAADIPKLVYTPASGLNKNTPVTFTYKVNDGLHESTDAATITINVEAEDDIATEIALGAPVATLATDEDTTSGIKLADINLMGDPDGGNSGTLQLLGSPTARDLLEVADDGDGGFDLRIKMGVTLTEGTFSVTIRLTENNDVSVGYSLTIEPPNIAPTTTPATGLTITKDATHIFTEGNFGFADADGDALRSITIVDLPNAGTLTLDGVAVALGDVIAVARITAGDLVYTPPSGLTADAEVTFTYTVSDGEDSSPEAMMRIAVKAVNEPPTLAVADDDITFDSGVFVLTREQLDARDIDTPARGLTYTLTAFTFTDADAAFEVDAAGDGTGWAAIPTNGTGTFTQQQVDNGHVRLNAASGEGTLSVRVSDGATTIPAMELDAETIDVTVRVVEEVTGTEVGTAGDNKVIDLNTKPEAEKAIPRTLTTGIGNTTITLTSGNDKVDAGLGDDVINLTPGDDADDENIVIYRFGTDAKTGNTIAWSGGDSITGFTPGQDALVLSHIDGDDGGDAGVASFLNGLGTGFIATVTTEYRDDSGGGSNGGDRASLDNYSITGVEIHFAQAVVLPGGVLGGSILSITFANPIAWADAGTPGGNDHAPGFNSEWLNGAAGTEDDAPFNIDDLTFNDNTAGKMALTRILGLRGPEADDEVEALRSVAIGDGEANTIDLTDGVGEATQRGEWVVFGGGGNDTITLRADTPNTGGTPPASVTPPPPRRGEERSSIA